jgi:hypothetical protein
VLIPVVLQSGRQYAVVVTPDKVTYKMDADTDWYIEAMDRSELDREEESESEEYCPTILIGENDEYPDKGLDVGK